MASWAAIAVLLGLIGGFLTLVLGDVHRSTVKIPPTVVTEPEPREPTYGHPWPPIRELRKKLAPPPGDHRWQTKVWTNKTSGDIICAITLVNIPTNTDGESYQLNMTTDKKYPNSPSLDHTWAHEYRAYPGIKKSTFYSHFLGPAIDWSTAVVNKIAGPNDDLELK